MTSTRHPAPILAVDIADYSRVMGEDEATSPACSNGSSRPFADVAV